MAPQKLTNPGDFYQFVLSNSLSKSVSADKPVTLALFANGECGPGNFGDPTMVLIPAIQQFSSDYTFTTISVDGVNFTNYIAVIMKDSHIRGLRFDGLSITQTNWKAADGRSGISSTEFKIATGIHTISHVNPQV